MLNNHILAYFLLFIVNLPLFSKASIWIYFFANQEKIIQTKCVNKDIPDSCCKGKCYLGAQIKKTDEPVQDGKNMLPISIRYKEIPAEVNEQLQIQNSELKFFLLKFPERFYSLINSSNQSVFHPPEA